VKLDLRRGTGIFARLLSNKKAVSWQGFTCVFRDTYAFILKGFSLQTQCKQELTKEK
jgi:hypothetical protein